MSSTPFRYRANGLTLESAIELPELVPSQDEPDVSIRYGAVPAELEGPVTRGARYQAAPGQYLLDLPGVARYWVNGRSDVVIAPEPGSSEEDIRVFILSSIMGVLAHLNGFLPLHASAVEVNGECVLFAGDSGAGKSTLAAAFHRRGHPLVADDICAISLDERGQPVVHPGYRHLKLWADALARVGESLGESRKLRVGMQKYSVLLHAPVQATPLRVSRVFVLTTLADAVQLRALEGRAKMAVLMKETYRLRLMKRLGDRTRHFGLCHAVGERTPVIRVSRPFFLRELDGLVRHLEQDIHAAHQNGR